MRCHQKDLALSLELAADLRMQDGPVHFDRQGPTKSKNSRHGKAHRPAMNLPQDLNIQEDSKYLDDALSQKAFRVI